MALNLTGEKYINHADTTQSLINVKTVLLFLTTTGQNVSQSDTRSEF